MLGLGDELSIFGDKRWRKIVATMAPWNQRSMLQNSIFSGSAAPNCCDTGDRGQLETAAATFSVSKHLSHQGRDSQTTSTTN